MDELRYVLEDDGTVRLNNYLISNGNIIWMKDLDESNPICPECGIEYAWIEKDIKGNSQWSCDCCKWTDF